MDMSKKVLAKQGPTLFNDEVAFNLSAHGPFQDWPW